MLKRAMTVLAGTALMVPAIALSASANDTVGKVVDNVTTTVEGSADGIVIETPADGTVKRVVGGVNPGDGGGVIGGGDVGPVRGTSPVVGYIFIESNETLGLGPTYQVWGQLADPLEWTCAGNGTTATFSVTCTPVAVLPVAYKCDVLHADISTASAGSSGRTTLDCDSDGAGEAQTATVSGAGGHDSVWSVDGRGVSAFTCTIDNGRGDYVGGCGDPGTVDVTVG